jgi:hypothetical protein
MSCSVHKLIMLLVRLLCPGRLHKSALSHGESAEESCRASCNDTTSKSGSTPVSASRCKCCTYNVIYTPATQAFSLCVQACDCWSAEHRTPTVLLSAELKAVTMRFFLLFNVFPPKLAKEVDALLLFVLHPMAKKGSLTLKAMLLVWVVRYVQQ